MPYHPNNPPSRKIQPIIRDTLLKPQRDPDLATLQSYNGIQIGINRFIIAYHKQKNLKEHLFQRKYIAEEERPASIYAWRNQSRADNDLPKFQQHTITKQWDEE